MKKKPSYMLIGLFLAAASGAWFVIWLLLDIEDLVTRPEWGLYAEAFVILFTVLLAIWCYLELRKWKNMVVNDKAKRTLAIALLDHAKRAQGLFVRFDDETVDDYVVRVQTEANGWINKSEQIVEKTELAGELRLGDADGADAFEKCSNEGLGVLNALIQLKKERIEQLAYDLRPSLRPTKEKEPIDLSSESLGISQRVNLKALSDRCRHVRDRCIQGLNSDEKVVKYKGVMEEILQNCTEHLPRSHSAFGALEQLRNQLVLIGGQREDARHLIHLSKNACHFFDELLRD